MASRCSQSKCCGCSSPTDVIDASGVEVTDDLAHLEVPSSVQAVVAARLDRLASEEREIVRDASVLGQSFTVDSLAGLREESVDKVERRLSDLVRREIFELVRDPRSPERGQYRWVQSVLREVMYGRISKSDRHQLHVRVARQLRSLGEPELAPVVASHFVAAREASTDADPGLQDELAEALGAAIQRAQVLHAHEQILGLVDSALAVVPAETEMDLREIGALAAVRLARFDDADRHAEAAMALAEADPDPRLIHRAVAVGGRVNNEGRNPRRAADILEPHLARFPDVDADPNLARAAVYLARSRLLLGDDVGAAALSDQALGAAERFDLVEDIADAMVTRGTALAFSQPRHSIALLRGALALAREHDLSDVTLRCLINIGYGGPDIVERRQATQEAWDEAKRLGDRSHATFVATNLAGYFSVTMEHDRLEALIADPLWPEKGEGLSVRAELAYKRGDTELGDELVAEAQELAAVADDPQMVLSLERAQAIPPFFAGRGREVFAIGKRHFEETPFAPILSASIALQGAAIERDPEMLAEVATFVEALKLGPERRAMEAEVEGLRKLVGGDIERGVPLIEQAISGWEALGMRWVTFELMVFAAAALPQGHETRTDLVSRARRLAEETEAPGLLAWIDRMTA